MCKIWTDYFLSTSHATHRN